MNPHSSNALGSMLDFLNRLRNAHIHHRIEQISATGLMITACIPGERWEIEFMADGSVEMERFEVVGRSRERKASRSCLPWANNVGFHRKSRSAHQHDSNMIWKMVFIRCLCPALLLMLQVCAATNDWFGIHVVDEATGRGVRWWS
jgi:hypothetical protein